MNDTHRRLTGGGGTAASGPGADGVIAEAVMGREDIAGIGGARGGAGVSSASAKVVLVGGGVHFEPVEAGERDLNDAALLLSSSSACCFLARACRSVHVSFLGPPETTDGLAVDSTAEAWAILSNGLTSFFGAGKLTGV